MIKIIIKHEPLLRTIYAETFDYSEKYTLYLDKKIEGMTAKEANEFWNEISDWLYDECYGAFEAGFKMALELMR